MKRVVFALAMGLALGSASAQQVWRCEQDGQVRYTDQPCEKSGRPLPARELKANVVDGLAGEAARAAEPASAASEAIVAGVPAASAASAAAGVVSPGVDPQVRPQPLASGRSYRGKHVMKVAMQGLMNTDFVQRGYTPRRQNPAFTSNP